MLRQMRLSKTEQEREVRGVWPPAPHWPVLARTPCDCRDSVPEASSSFCPHTWFCEQLVARLLPPPPLATWLEVTPSQASGVRARVCPAVLLMHGPASLISYPDRPPPPVPPSSNQQPPTRYTPPSLVPAHVSPRSCTARPCPCPSDLRPRHTGRCGFLGALTPHCHRPPAHSCRHCRLCIQLPGTSCDMGAPSPCTSPSPDSMALTAPPQGCGLPDSPFAVDEWGGVNG